MNVLRRFFLEYPTIKFIKGEIIIHQGEKPRSLYAIKSGIVETYNLTAEGDSRSISFSLNDDIFPVSWAFSKSSSALFFYKAYTDCELYKINKQDFVNKVNESLMFCRAVLEVQTKSQIGHQLQTDALTKTNGRKKILYMFRYFCLRYGRDLQNNLVKIQIPLTKQEIANWVGLTRETVTIALHRLAGQGIIRSEKKYYLVDTKKLNRRIVDEYDSGIWINKLHQ